jgi:hypothetical protein
VNGKSICNSSTVAIDQSPGPALFKTRIHQIISRDKAGIWAAFQSDGLAFEPKSLVAQILSRHSSRAKQ